MSQGDHIPTDWNSEDKFPGIGEYIWQVRILSCEFRKPRGDETWKPHMLLNGKIEEGAWKGFKFDFRVYISPRAERIARWFLKKFGYPNDLLQCKPPVLRSGDIVGLRGKVLISVEEDRQGLADFKANGFERLGESELEERQERHTLKEIDLEWDLKQEEDPFAGLT